MTVNRITFECRGQEFHWWEVDMTTGRILGCGPLQAEVWANGRCSVDVATVQVGQRPTFHGPATEPDGRTLQFEIAAISPADGGAVFQWGAP